MFLIKYNLSTDLAHDRSDWRNKIHVNEPSIFRIMVLMRLTYDDDDAIFLYFFATFQI